MIHGYPQCIIEIGNFNLKCIIFKIDDNSLKILSTSTYLSEGIHNGVIKNLVIASHAIRSCIGDAEKKAQVLLKNINVVVEQPEFLCTKLSKDRKINGSKIQKEDIEFLLREAKKQVVLNDKTQSIIHIFNHNYIVDGKTFIEEPVNVYADHLSHEMTFVTAPLNNIKNIHQAFSDCDIEVERVISSTFATAIELLNINQLQTGSSLINIEFEKTSIGLFKNLALIHSMTFPIGFNHIVKDISKVCSLTIKESESIKNKIDLSLKNNEELFDNNNYLKSNFFNNSIFRKISKSLLLNITKARLDEIFKIVEKQINLSGFNSTCGRNIFLTSEGSNLQNLKSYCENFFKLNVNTKNNNKSEIDLNFLSCLGASKIIKDGWETEALPKKISKYGKKTSFLAKIFGF